MTTVIQKPVGRRHKRLRPTGWSFVLAFVVMLVVFGVVPTVWALVTSFIVTPPVGVTYFSFTDNYVAVLRDPRFNSAATNVGIYLAIWLPALLATVFVIALVMDARRTRFSAVTRFVTYVPGAVVGSAAALLWIYMFTPNVSPFGTILRLVGGDENLLRESTFPLVLAVIGISVGAGAWIVLLYGALSTIPQDLVDASRIDGANQLKTIWYVKLPLIKNYAAFILIVSMANGFQVFAEPQVIASGARGLISSTWSLNQLAYTYATAESNYGRASALSVAILAISVVAAVVTIRAFKFYRKGD